MVRNIKCIVYIYYIRFGDVKKEMHRGCAISADARRRRREGSSCHRQDLVPDEVETNSIGARRSKRNAEVASSTFWRKLFPRIGFGEDAFGEAFGAIAVRLLDNLERQFWHMFMIRHVFARAGRTSHDSSAGGKLDPVNGRDEEIRLDPTRDGQTLAPTIALT
jgi:hypothetical protein